MTNNDQRTSSPNRILVSKEQRLLCYTLSHYIAYDVLATHLKTSPAKARRLVFDLLDRTVRAIDAEARLALRQEKGQ